MNPDPMGWAGEVMRVLFYGAGGGGLLYGGHQIRERFFPRSTGKPINGNGTSKEMVRALNRLVILAEYEIEAARTHHYMEIAQGRLQRAIARNMQDGDGRNVINVADFAEPETFILPDKP